MGKFVQKGKKASGAFVKLQGQAKFKKNTEQNKVNKQKVPVIKKNAVATANTRPTKEKEPKSNLSKLVSPVAAGKVKPKKVPAGQKKKVNKPKPTANKNPAGTQPKGNAEKPVSPAKPPANIKPGGTQPKSNVQKVQKPVSPAKPEKKSKKKSIEENPEKKAYDPEDKKRTIFVGNLAPNTKSIQVEKFFKKFGEVKSVRLRTAGGKKLFKHKMRKSVPALNAYVVLKNEEGIAKALEESGCEFKGRHIRITRTTCHDVDSKRVLFVGNLKFSATDEKLHDIFSTCGEIEYVRTLQGENGCKGIAYVGFKKPESVTLALELNNTMLDERPIRVERYSKYKQDLKKKQNEEQGHKPQKQTGKQTGAIKRIADKLKKEKSANNMKNGKTIKQSPKGNKKKSFRGVKVDIKKKPMKKKSPAMVQLAKKIAPKS